MRRSKSTYPRAVRMVERRQIDLDALVTDRFPLAEVSGAFTTAASREGLKTVVLP